MKQKRNSRKEIKLLLLGAGESGKSTFLKQMKIIHEGGFDERERIAFTPVVYQNVYLAIQNLIRGMELLKKEYEGGSRSEACAERLKATDYLEVKMLPKADVEDIDVLWRDRGVRECHARRNEFYISDSAEYFLDHLDRIAGDDFVPTVEDVLRVRTPTSGINEYCFDQQVKREEIRFRLVDVGGQRTERRKWIHAFENVTSLIFLVAMSEYDQRLLESHSENRLEESLALFKTLMGFPWFRNSSIILFLNKKDLLELKIKTSHLIDYFPSFSGPKRDSEAAKAFMKDMFVAVGPPERTYAFYTCATGN